MYIFYVNVNFHQVRMLMLYNAQTTNWSLRRWRGANATTFFYQLLLVPTQENTSNSPRDWLWTWGPILSPNVKFIKGLFGSHWRFWTQPLMQTLAKMDVCSFIPNYNCHMGCKYWMTCHMCEHFKDDKQTWNHPPFKGPKFIEHPNHPFQIKLISGVNIV